MNKIKNYIGVEIGKFEVLNQKRENNKTYLYCKCKKCGKEKWIAQGNVKRIKCCEFNHSSTEFKPLDLTNQTINNITILEKTEQRKRGAVVWKCKCFCGNIFYAPIYRIKNGEIKSCGCKRKVYREENFKKLKEACSKKYVDGTFLPLIKNPKLRSNNKSGIHGVHKKGNRWIASITIANQAHRIGSFDDIKKAEKARKDAEEKYFNPILEKYKNKH